MRVRWADISRISCSIRNYRRPYVDCHAVDEMCEQVHKTYPQNEERKLFHERKTYHGPRAEEGIAMQDHNKILQRELTHVYWMGGSPCAGKSSIADILAATYGLSLYRADEAYFRHEKVVTPEQHPIFYKLTHYSPQELWMRSVEQQVVEEMMLYREEFPLILEELLALPRSQSILAEGAALLPESVLPFLLEPQRAIWIIPTAEFQLHHYDSLVRPPVQCCIAARETIGGGLCSGYQLQSWLPFLFSPSLVLVCSCCQVHWLHSLHPHFLLV